MPASNLMPSNSYFNMFSWNYCYVKCFGRITKLSRGKVKKDHKKWTSGHFSKTLPPPRWISGHFGPNIFFLFFAFLFLIKLEVSGPYGPLTSSPCRGLACCTRWGPLCAQKKFVLGSQLFNFFFLPPRVHVRLVTKVAIVCSLPAPCRG